MEQYLGVHGVVIATTVGGEDEVVGDLSKGLQLGLAELLKLAVTSPNPHIGDGESSGHGEADQLAKLLWGVAG